MTALAQDIPPCVFDNAGEVLQACETVRQHLAQAAMRGDLHAINGCRKAAADIRVAVIAGDLGDDAEMDADEMLRRTERALGLALRSCQANGTFRTAGQRSTENAAKPVPADYASRGDLYGGGNGRSGGIYHLTDGITDEAFEAALAACREAGSMARSAMRRYLASTSPTAPCLDGVPSADDRSLAAIGRRLDIITEMAGEGHSSQQIGARIHRKPETVRDIARREGIVIRGDEVVGRRRALDSRRIVEETVSALEGLAMSVRLAELADIDPALFQNWVTSLTRTLPVLTRLKRDLIKEITQ